MTRIENECVGCGLPCLGLILVPIDPSVRYYCDECGMQADAHRDMRYGLYAIECAARFLDKEAELYDASGF